MTNQVNKYRNQWDKDKDDNFGSVMPIMVYRVTWKDRDGVFYEFWSESENTAVLKKCEIDYSQGKYQYVNFESWFAYRSDEHDKRFGRVNRDKGWWEGQ
jgi:hypothetical protein